MTRAPGSRGAAADLAWVPGGTFAMGSDRHCPEEAPAHAVTVDDFWIGRHLVTNRDFARFVAETGHVTLAERPADPADYPGAPPEMLAPASSVFVPPAGPADLCDPYAWWALVPGADWRHPGGPGTSIDGLDDHPVVHVAAEDAEAYAAWAGMALPTEAEWERAARGGLEGCDYVWGDTLSPGGRRMANTWQGRFPDRGARREGEPWTSPVDAFPANGYGLHDMAGNVWQWTADWYRDHAAAPRPCCATVDPRGGGREESVDPFAPGSRIPRRVVKGGSFLCAPDYCRRYRPAARLAQPVDTPTCHLGFRCILRPRSGRGDGVSDRS